MTTGEIPVPLARPEGANHAQGGPRSWLWPVGPGQIVAWAAAVAVPLVFHPPGQAALFLLIALAASVVAATSIRFAERHLAGWAFVWISYRLLQHGDHLTTDPLRVLVHDFRLRQHRDRAGHPFGIAGIGDGWSAVIRVSGEPQAGALVAVARAACENGDIPLSGTQVIVRTDGDKRVWMLAVRYRASQAPLAALLRGGGEEGELRTTARAALAVMSALAGAGYRSGVLDAGELAAELRTALGGLTLSSVVTDGWRSWSSSGTTQACFTPLGEVDPASMLTAKAPTASLTVASYSLWRTGSGEWRDEKTVRLVKYQGIRNAPRAAEVGLPAIPLFGRQAAGMRRTLPLALPR
ncbi:MAG TPA: type VII secretion protein EccE [Amycolatopsis sp.]|uniref:type VII secretion protein EccE n=1 Tax=Amycolatopsis sp. TaxID=37632 RepID=UPI002B48E639|nr:type VII secretion protein EccE [Amycolatopsis sp.]HKS49019.1 type VII secretion protein EccE [Amycolatopsis sp.]